MEDIKMAEKLILTTNDLNCAAALVAKEIKIKIPLKKRVYLPRVCRTARGIPCRVSFRSSI
jgi:hypothetical protein